MKIGIMSMQRVRNLGSFLQAYALKKTVESLGHEVVFIDYQMEQQGKKESMLSSRISFDKIFRFLRHRSTPQKIQMYKKASSFDSYYDSFMPFLGVESKMIYGTQVDTLIIGSDEVFNCFQCSDDTVDSFDFFGENQNTKKCISYAASFGSTTLDKLKNNSDFCRIKKDLNGFSAVSVRDKNSYQIMQELIADKNVEMHLDPVLIYDFAEEIKTVDVNGPYIVVYSYRGRINREEGKAIRKFAKSKGMKLVCTGFIQDCCDDYLLLNPFEVLGLFKSASYVITDTFHGTVLSIKYGKQFATIIRENNKQKLSDLLEKFNLQRRRLTDLSLLDATIEQYYDKGFVQQLIQQEKNKTISFLNNNL